MFYCVFARTVHQFFPNNMKFFFPTGGATAPPAPPPRTLMHASCMAFKTNMENELLASNDTQQPVGNSTN